MKELGRIRRYFSTDKENWIYIDNSHYIYYKEPEDIKILECNYDDIEKYTCLFCLHEPGLFDKKEYKYYSDLCSDPIFIVYPDQKLYIKEVWKKCDNCNSFEYLSKNMVAEDFICYLKDHGLNVCPMKYLLGKFWLCGSPCI